MTNFIGGIIDKAAEIRNNFLRGFLRYNPFDKLKGIFDKLENSSIGKVAKKIDGITRSLEEYQKVVRNVWRGNYNNRGDNPDRFDLLRKEGWNPHVVQTLVNKGSKYKLTVEDITAAEKKWGVTSAKSAEQVTETVESLSDAKLEELDYKVNVQIEFADDELAYLEYLIEKIENRAFSAADAIANLGYQTQAYFNQNDAYEQGVKDIFGNHGLTDDDFNK